jgi:translocation and assembly module TamB
MRPPLSPPPPQKTRRAGWRKAGRLLLIIFGTLLSLLLLAVVGGLIWLHTGGGRQELGELVTSAARNAIKGDLRVKAIRVTGFLDLCVDGVELRDPEGDPVIKASRLCLHVNPLALRANKVLLSKVRLDDPWIDIATIPDPDKPGATTTTLARALLPKVQKAPAPDSGPLKWVISVADLALTHGAVALRPALKAPTTFELDQLNLSDAHARYAADGAAAGLQLSAQLISPGKLPVAIELDAAVTGAVTTGAADIKKLHLQLGKSGLTATGQWDLAKNAGQLHLRELVIEPDDVERILHQRPLEAQLKGDADLTSDGSKLTAVAHLDGAGGRVQVNASSTTDFKKPVWAIDLDVDHVDPGALSPRAPHGQVTARIDGKGNGIPTFDKHGVLGDLDLDVHVGPAHLDRLGPVVVDLKANLDGRTGDVKAFTASALGLKLNAHGHATRDALALDVQLDAPDLKAVGRAVGVMTKKKPPPLDGTLHLTARVTGSPSAPQAQVHLRAPQLRYGPGLVANGLAVDGNLSDMLREPSGRLSIAASNFALGQIALGAPSIDMDLQWPVAHLRIDAGVAQGRLTLAGDATIDDDKDGLVLSRFTVSYPGNELQLVRNTNVHFRDDTIIEPFELAGPHGELRLSAQISPPTPHKPGRIEAAVVLQRFDLEHLPEFALPGDLGLRGIVDADAVVAGALPSPDVDLKIQFHNGGLKRLEGIGVDAQAHAHLHAGRLIASGTAGVAQLAKLRFDADVPAQSPKTLSPSAPLKLELVVSDVDLKQLADKAKLTALQQQGARGFAELRLVGTGTLATPRITVSLRARELGTAKIQHLDARAGVLVEKGRAALDGELSVEGAQALGLTASTPFDLTRALKDPAYLKSALQRAVTAEVAVTHLELSRLAKAGILPAGSDGAVNLSLRLTGTPLSPEVKLSASGDSITVGKLQGLDFQSDVALGKNLQLKLGAQAKGTDLARLEGTVGLSGAEVVELARKKPGDVSVGPLLDRPVNLALDIPGLILGRVAQMAGRKESPAEGRLEGRVTLTGSPARPRLVAKLSVRDVSAGTRQLGQADVYVEADSAGALLHLGMNPPGGGKLEAHAQLKADLGARTLLRDGFAPVMDAPITGRVDASKLDLVFLSGLAPNLRHTGGTLDAHVAVEGALARPKAQGDAHLRHGVFDVVGQGVFQDVGLDATFSPKEVVVDRVTGSTGQGTFSAVLVAAMKPGNDTTPDKVELTGEVHLGDAESVRDRKGPNGLPLRAGPLPLRQAGAHLADVTAELDLFGNFSDGLLDLNAKIPESRVVIRQLPNKKLPSLAPNPDVLLVHPNERPHPPGREPDEVEAETKARKAATFRLHAHLQLKHLYVKAPDFEFPVESDINFDYDAKHPDVPTADGTVHVPEGSFSALGRRFTIQNALITETGGDIQDPELDVKAQFENSSAAVTIDVSGSAKDPQITMSSTPPMSQDAIAFFLATGRVQGRAAQSGSGVDLSSAATSVLGGLLFGQVRKSLASVLPVDVLTIETGAGGGVAQASVGKYIGDRIFIGYRQSFTNDQFQNVSEGRIEYEISRAVEAQATVGDKSKDISILYTKDF